MDENVVKLDDYRGCELLATVDVYRHPDGSILLGPSFMDEREIEAVETISERFQKLAEWVGRGKSSLLDQAQDFEGMT